MSPATNPAAAPAPGPTKKPAKVTLPVGQTELATLAEAAATAWQASALPALLWCAKADLGKMAAAYRASLGTADAAGDSLSPTAQRLRELDQTLETSLKYVKNYLVEAFGPAGAKAHYDEFGLGPKGRLPTARPARVLSVGKLLAGLQAHQLAANKYGTAYWQPLADEYARLVQASSATRQAAAGEVGAKNSQEKPLRKVLRALRLSIRANFPDTYAAELRRFGFLSESF